MIKDFRELFRKKQEETRQDRAERTRRDKKLEEQLNETQHNLERLFDELSKKKGNGDSGPNN